MFFLVINTTVYSYIGLIPTIFTTDVSNREDHR